MTLFLVKKMSTFRVRNNYADGFVDSKGFIRTPRYIYDKLIEIDKQIIELNKDIDNIETNKYYKVKITKLVNNTLFAEILR